MADYEYGLYLELMSYFPDDEQFITQVLQAIHLRSQNEVSDIELQQIVILLTEQRSKAPPKRIAFESFKTGLKPNYNCQQLYETALNYNCNVSDKNLK